MLHKDLQADVVREDSRARSGAIVAAHVGGGWIELG